MSHDPSEPGNFELTTPRAGVSHEPCDMSCNCSAGDDRAPVLNSSKPARGKVYIKTFGCQMNEYDTEKLYKLLEDQYSVTKNPREADLVIVNTCSVRDKPEQKLYSMLGELNELKQEKPHLLVGVGGCVAQQEGEKIVKRSKAVDLVFGTHNLSLVPSLVQLRKDGSPPQVAIDYRDEWEELPPGFSEPNRVSVFVSISRGCNKACSYCIVPTTRGKEVSRSLPEILKEVRIAVHRGAKEVTLLGQTVNSWGLDFKPRLRFAHLVDEISKVEGLERIRFTSPHPQEIKSDFIDLMASNPKICRHVHMPLQSGNDRILQAMNRNYRVKRYLQIIDELKSKVPELEITTDIIVGYPGETDAEYRGTLEVMRQVQFINSYSFMFSPRPGTPAAFLEDSVSAEEKLARLQELQALQVEDTNARLGSFIGRKCEILLEGAAYFQPECMQGRNSQNITCNLSAPLAGLKPGMLITAWPIHASRNTLRVDTTSPVVQS